MIMCSIDSLPLLRINRFLALWASRKSLEFSRFWMELMILWQIDSELIKHLRIIRLVSYRCEERYILPI